MKPKLTEQSERKFRAEFAPPFCKGQAIVILVAKERGLIHTSTYVRYRSIS